MSAHLQRLDRIFGENDPKAFKLINEGSTLGIFQLESPLIRRLIRMTEIKTIYDICLSISITRPAAGDEGKYKEFVERRLGQKPITYPHADLEPYLKKTYGVLMFEEQIMQIGVHIGDISANDARELQKCLAKGDLGESFEKYEMKFVHGMWHKGYTNDEVKPIMIAIRRYAGYGFCEAHAINYAYMAYYSACMKAHYPTEFMCAVLNNEGGYYDTASYIEEARRLGIKILPPDVNTAEAGFTIPKSATKCRPISHNNHNRSITRPIHKYTLDRMAAFQAYCERETIRFIENLPFYERIFYRNPQSVFDGFS